MTSYLKAHYLDASVAVWLVYQEPNNGTGVKNFINYVNEKSGLYITSFSLAETFGVLKRKYLKKQITLEHYRYCCSVLSALIQQNRVHVEETGLHELEIFIECDDLVATYKLDYSDALQLLTVKKGKFAHWIHESKTLFITADSQLEAAALKEQLRVWNPLKESLPK